MAMLRAHTAVFALLIAGACSQPPVAADATATGIDATSTDGNGAGADDVSAVDAPADTPPATADAATAVADAAAADAAATVDVVTEVAADAVLTDAAEVAPAPDTSLAEVVDSATAADSAPDTTPDTAIADGLLDPPADAIAVDAAAPPQTGCSDGTREGFLDKQKYPLAAGCSGAWDIAGIHKGNPACGRQGGNTGTNAAGKGCNVEDLCAEGWHVCYGAKDLKERNPAGCGGISDGGGQSPAFFLARSSSTGAFNCSQDSTKFGAPGTSNDLFGCGDLGCPIEFKTYPTCDPLNRASHDLCKGLRNDMGCGDWCAHLGKFAGQKNTWDCGKDGVNEANAVLKADPLVQGGVLCCADSSGKP